MKRLFSVLTVFSMMLGCNLANAVERFQEGTHYTRISPAQPTSAPAGKVEVREFFWYGCPHCHTFEPVLHNWVQSHSESIDFGRIPVVFRPDWGVHAKGYYAAEALGIIENVHQAIFDEIHKDKKPLDKMHTLAAFIAKTSGLEEPVVLDTMKSFAVETKIRKAEQMSRAYRLRGVPAIAIAGKYTVTAGQVGTGANMMEVVDFLIAKARVK